MMLIMMRMPMTTGGAATAAAATMRMRDDGDHDDARFGLQRQHPIAPFPLSRLLGSQVTTWGVFPRPQNISQAYGGGRNIKPGQELETPEQRAKREVSAAGWPVSETLFHAMLFPWMFQVCPRAFLGWAGVGMSTPRGVFPLICDRDAGGPATGTASHSTHRPVPPRMPPVPDDGPSVLPPLPHRSVPPCIARTLK